MSDEANLVPKRSHAHVADVANVLASAPRLELLELLAQREQTIEELAQTTGLPPVDVSQHLQQLRHIGLVSNRRDGKHIHYRLADDQVVTLIDLLRAIAERNHAKTTRAIDQNSCRRDALEPVSHQELLPRQSVGGVRVTDGHPSEKFSAGHANGAINVLLKELKRWFAEFPRRRETGACCCGPCESWTSRRWNARAPGDSKPFGSRMGFPNGRSRSRW